MLSPVLSGVSVTNLSFICCNLARFSLLRCILLCPQEFFHKSWSPSLSAFAISYTLAARLCHMLGPLSLVSTLAVKSLRGCIICTTLSPAFVVLQSESSFGSILGDHVHYKQQNKLWGRTLNQGSGLQSLFAGSTFTVLSRKRDHGQSTVQVCQRGGWALFRLFSHLTTKERPRHVYSDSKHSKQIIGHKITYNGITSGFEVESWRHTTLWTARRDGEHGVARSAHHISYILLCKDALY